MCWVAAWAQTGPADTNPETGKPYGLGFPLITIRDMVRAQKMLIDALGIERLFAVIGGSMGGMQVLQWAASYPQAVRACIPIACAARHSAQNIALHEVGRQAIMADPDWKDGDYASAGTFPSKGLAVARMAAHIITCRKRRCSASSAAIYRTVPRCRSSSRPISKSNPICIIKAPVSSTASMPTPISISLGRWIISIGRGTWRASRRRLQGFADTLLYYCLLQRLVISARLRTRRVAHALNAVAGNVSFVEIRSDKGHDAFLLDEPEMFAAVQGFISSVAREAGLP